MYQTRIIVLAADHAELRIALRKSGGVELHAVEEIEYLGPELQSDPLRDRCVLDHRETEVRDTRSAGVRQRTRHIAESKRRRKRKRGRVKPAIEALLRRAAQTGAGPVLLGREPPPNELVLFTAVVRLSGVAGLESGVAIETPSGDDLAADTGQLERMG